MDDYFEVATAFFDYWEEFVPNIDEVPQEMFVVMYELNGRSEKATVH